MRHALLVALLLSGACAHGNTLFRRKSDVTAEVRADSLYWSAVTNLDPMNKSGTLDAAIASLDAYLASPGKLKHAHEAGVLRTLARNSQQLARLEAALQQTRLSAAGDTKTDSKAETKPRADPDSKAAGRDEEMVKEIQRLKEELAKANEELDRIKKRLAAPPTKP